MLDIKFVRNNPDVVKQNIKNKFQDEKLPLVDEVIELDKRNREIKQEVEALRAEKNKASKEIGAMMAQKKIEEAEALKLQEKLGLTDEEVMQIVRSGRGQGLLCAGKNRISVEIRASQAQHELITTSRTDLEKRAKKEE